MALDVRSAAAATFIGGAFLLGCMSNPDAAAQEVGGSANAGSSSASAGAAGVSGASGGAINAGGAGMSSGGASGASGASGLGGSAGTSGTGGVPGLVVEEVLDIADVWSGHPVNFALVTRGDRQFAAFYNDSRQMTVASRMLGTTTWELVTLPTTLGWDSHNHVAMAADGAGRLHVAGNMHNVPLTYFRTSAPLEIATFAPSSMIGSNETSCTYPEFFRGPEDELIFLYRDGGSGNGNHIFNVYSEGAQSWSRLLDTPLTDGEGLNNAYPVGPIQGPDGLFHLVWVWRDTPDASTNHNLSYARSADALNWEGADGAALALPITLASGDIVDPVPMGGGMINNNTKVGFDSQIRPVVVYHKFDESGFTQLYNARFEDGAWVVHKTSNWSYRWEFGGGGTLVFEIEVEPVRLQADGSLTQNYYHAQYGGRGTFLIDETTLAAVGTIDPLLPYPRELDTPESPTPGMIVRWASDAEGGADPALKYMLRWETLASNADMPRPDIPPPTKLRLYAFRQVQ